MTFSKLHLSVGERKVELELTGLEPEAQLTTLKGIVNNFFDELANDLKVSAEPTDKPEELNKAAKALGFSDRNDLVSMAEAFNGVDFKKRERSEVPEKPLSERWYRELPDGRTLYQTYYICTHCRHKGKRFVSQGDPFCRCHECGVELILKAAAAGPFPHKDIYNNVYIAGKFIRADQFEPFKTLADAEAEAEEEERKEYLEVSCY